MILRNIFTLCFILFTGLCINAQNEGQLYGNFEPCRTGCYKYLFQDSLQQTEYWLENISEPAPMSHSVQVLYPWNGTTEAGYEICFELQGVYTFLSYFYSSNGNTIIDSFDIIVGGTSLPLEIIELNPCSNSADVYSACKNSTKSYEALPQNPNGDPIFGTWEVGGADSYGESGSVITVTWGDGDYGYLYFQPENDECYFGSEITISLIDNPLAQFAIENNKNKYCMGEDIFLINESLDANHFMWDFGDGTSSTDVQPIKSYSEPGTYLITLMALNGCDCSDVYSLEVNIDDAWMPQIDCRGTICEDTRVTYTCTDDCGVFNWNISDNGLIVGGGATDQNFITIQWMTGPEGVIDLNVSSCSGDMCPTPAKFIIPIISDEAVIKGNLIPCIGSTESYTITDFGATDYSWTVTGGVVKAGFNSNSVMIEWTSITTGSIEVSYNNCYLECGGSTSTNVTMTDEFKLEGLNKFCQGENIIHNSLNATSNTPTPVDWELIDPQGNVQNAQTNNEFLFSSEGLLGKYQLVARSNVHCNEIDSTTIVISPLTEPADSITGEFAICPGNSYQYEVHSNISNVEFKWEINDGGTITEMKGNPVIHTWTSTGPYVLNVAQKNNSGDYCYSEFITETLLEVTALSVNGVDSVCADELAKYYAPEYVGLNYEWSINPTTAGTIITENGKPSVDILWNESGLATVRLQACGKLEEFEVDVAKKPEFNVIHEDRLCYNLKALTSIDEVYEAYLWKNDNDFPIGNTADLELSPGTYTIEVTTDRGCTNLENFTIKELPKPDVHISTPDSTGLCPEDNPSFPTLYAVDSDGGYQYEWYANNEATPNLTNLFSADSLGRYKVLVTDNNNCTAFSNSINVFEYCGKCSGGPATGTTCANDQDCESDTGILDFDVVAGMNCRTLSFVNQSVNISDGTYIWNFEDFQSPNNIVYDENPTHTFSNPGFYVVSLKGNVEDKNNPGDSCTAWFAKAVTIPLKANFSTIPGCPRAPIEFIDRSTFLPGYEITSHEWDFGDPSSGSDNTSTDVDPLHTYNSAGIYEAQLVVGNGGCTDTIRLNVIVHELPEADILFTESMCEDLPVKNDLVLYNQVIKADWNFSDPTSGEKNESSVFPTWHEFADPGIYNIVTELESIYGCTDTKNEDIQIYENTLSGDISSSGGSPICEGTMTTLIPPSGTNFVWSTNDSTNTIIVNEANVYTVTVYDDNLCKYTPDDFLLEVNPAPKVSLYAETYDDVSFEILDGLDVQICEGEQIRLIATDNDNFTYTWSNAVNGNILDFPEASTLTQGIHVFYVTVSDNISGCTFRTAELTINVLPNPLNLTIQANSNGILCGGESHILSVQNPDSNINYVWNNGESGISIETSIGGLYFVNAYNMNGCSSVSNTITVEHGPDVDQVPSGCFVRCNPDTLCFPDVIGAVSYQWYFNDTPVDASQGGTIPEIIIVQDGTYELEITNNLGCTNKSEPLTLTLEDAVGTFKGVIYFDLDGDGTISAGDSLINNMTIKLSNGLFTETNEDGSFSIPDVPNGTYAIEYDTTGFGDLKILSGLTSVTIIDCDEIVESKYLLTNNCNRINLGVVTHHLCPGDKVTEGGETFDQAGSFIVFIPNSTGCLDTLNVEITQSVDRAVELTTSNTCEGETNGTIDIEITGSNLTFELNNGLYTNNIGTFSDLESGEYDLQVIDIEGCIVAEASGTVSEIASIYLGLEEHHLCLGESIEIFGVTYDEPITQSVMVENAQGCFDQVDLAITASAELESVSFTTIEACKSSTNGQINIEISGPASNLDFYLNDGEFNSSSGQFEGLSPDIYQLTIEDEFGCALYAEEIELDESAGLEYEIEEGEWDCQNGLTSPSVIFSEGTGEFATVEWKNGKIGQSGVDVEEGWFHVLISNDCESVTEEIFIERAYEEVKIVMPNIFSPNDDGINEDFGLITDQLVNPKVNNFVISDRMGRIVYNYSGNTDAIWNGKHHSGDYMPQGVYFYYIEVEHDVCGYIRKQTVSGDVTIIR